MDFSLNEEQKAIQEMALVFSHEALRPYAQKWDAEALFPIETFQKAAALGLAGLYVREENGGAGLDRLSAILVFESLSQGCVSTAAYLSIHNMVAWIIDRFGTSEHHRKFLPDLLSMKKFGSYCLTEPNSGSDAASLKTKAILKGDHYIINGEKAFISGGGVSDIYIVMVRTGNQNTQGISAFIVEKDAPGIRFGRPEHKMGWSSQPTTAVIFEDCAVPKENLLGQEGEGFKIALKALDGGRLNIAACSLGGATRCLEMAHHYMQERTQFGKKLSSFQALQFCYANMASDLEASRLLLYKAGWTLSHQSEEIHTQATLFSAMAKKFVTDQCFNIANQALQIHGGYGYIKDYEVERFVRDLRVHQILEGTNEIMRVIIARKLLGDIK